MNKLKLTALSCLLSFALISCEEEETLPNSLNNTDFALTGDQVVPASNSTAGGSIKGTYDRKEKLFTYTLTWTGLSGNITAAHIHGVADRGFVAIPVAPLAAYPNGIVQTITGFTNGTAGSFTGNLYVDGTVVKEHDLLAGKFYVDLHTAANPGGEIRGQILFPQ